MATGLIPIGQADIGPGLSKAPGAVTLRSLESRLDEAINIKDYGAVGDGVANDSMALSLALSAIGVYERELVLPYGAYKINTVTIPENVTLTFLPSAFLSVPTGQTLTINGKINAGLYPIFQGVGTIKTDREFDVYPEWFGEYESNDGQSLAKALAFLDSTIGGAIYLQSRYYVSPWYTDLIMIEKKNIKIIGAKMAKVKSDKTRLELGTGTILARSVFVSADNFSISDVGIDAGSWVCANLTVNSYAGAGGTDGLMIVGRASLKYNASLRNVQSLLSSSTTTYHGILVEKYNGVEGYNLNTFYGAHGLAIKSKNVNISDIHTSGHEFNGVIIKADAGIDCEDVNLYNVTCLSVDTATYDGAGVRLEAYDGNPLTRIRVYGLTAISCQWAFYIAPRTNSQYIHDVVIEDVFVIDAETRIRVSGTGGFNVTNVLIRALTVRGCPAKAIEFSHTRECELRYGMFRDISLVSSEQYGVLAVTGNYHLRLQDIYLDAGVACVFNTNPTYPVFLDGMLPETGVLDHGSSGSVLFDGIFSYSSLYSPTASNAANCAVLTPRSTIYTKIGNVVTCAGTVDVDITTASIATAFVLTLPIASNLTNAWDLSGVAIAHEGGQTMGIYADTTSDKAVFQNNAGWATTTSITMRFSFSYTIK